MKNYFPNDDYAKKSEDWQGVQLNIPEDDKYKKTYTDRDCLENKPWQDNRLYITISEDQKALLDRNDQFLKSGHYDQKENLPNEGYPGFSGYFTDEATASRRYEGEKGYDAVALGNDLQQLPYYNEDKYLEAKLQGEKYIPGYNHHLACFEIDRDKLEKEYGTREFMAALGKCEANNQFGAGGGNQGYNPYINELYNQGCLIYNPELARTSTNTKCENYNEMREMAEERAKYCAENHVEVPSKEISDKYGYPHSETPVLSEPGNSPQLHTNRENDCLSARKGELTTENLQDSTMLQSASQGQLAGECLLNDNKEKRQNISEHGDGMNGLVSSPNTESWMGM